jgi:hypothetical protein
MLSDEQVDRLIARLDGPTRAVVDPFASRLLASLQPQVRAARTRDASPYGRWLSAAPAAFAPMRRSIDRSPMVWRMVAVLATLLLAGALAWAGTRRHIIPASQLGFRPAGSHLIEDPSSQSLAALLGDGRVIVVRGAYVDVYDPKADAYTSLKQGVRSGPGDVFQLTRLTTLLPDGRLMLVGPLATGLLDARTGDVAPGPALPRTLGAGSTATQLADGRVLFAGGHLTTTVPAAPSGLHEDLPGPVLLFDPNTMSFETGGSMVVPRFDHTATRLDDGRVLFAGGFALVDDQLQPVASAELYDPRTGLFSLTAPMPTVRSNATAALMRNGRVLVAGGGVIDHGTVDSTAVLYDPARAAWTSTGSLGAGRLSPSSIVLPDGRVLVMGGQTWLDAATVDTSADLAAEVYDPDSGTFSRTGRAALAHLDATLILLSNGEVFVTSRQPGVPGLGPDELFGPLP